VRTEARSLAISGAAYVVVTLLLYELLRPVSRPLSLLAAFFSLEGIAHAEDSVAYFGVYCLLLAYLIYQSTYLPRAIGVLMALAGVGLLINGYKFLLPPALAHGLSSAGYTLDAGEIVLALWRLVMGVDVRKWQEKESKTRVT